MAAVYVYLCEERYAPEQHCTTQVISDDVNLDLLAGEVVGVEVLSAHRVEIDGRDIAAELARARAVVEDLADWATLANRGYARPDEDDVIAEARAFLACSVSPDHAETAD